MLICSNPSPLSPSNPIIQYRFFCKFVVKFTVRKTYFHGLFASLGHSQVYLIHNIADREQWKASYFWLKNKRALKVTKQKECLPSCMLDPGQYFGAGSFSFRSFYCFGVYILWTPCDAAFWIILYIPVDFALVFSSVPPWSKFSIFCYFSPTNKTKPNQI